MHRVCLLDDYQEIGLRCADWSPLKDKVTIDVFKDTLADENALVTRLEPYEIVCAMRERTKFPASLLDRLPNLRLIATTGPVNAGIDVKHAKAKGIVVCGTGGKGNSTLEHIWGLLLATVRYISHDDYKTKTAHPQWQTKVPFGLSGRTLGLIGVGRLGSQTAKIAKAFDMRVIGWSPHLTKERAESAGVEFVESKEQLFRESDIVSLHMVLSPNTRHIVTSRELNLMKSTAFFINTSRGPLVEEQALIDALQSKQIAGAGLDVFDIEPLPVDHPLRSLENVTLTPHTGYVSDTNYETFWNQTVENIVAFLDGHPKRVIA